jgi:hypothetical protein
MLSAVKHLALLFVGGRVQSEILRFAENDSMADVRADVTLSSATDPLRAKDFRADVLSMKRGNSGFFTRKGQILGCTALFTLRWRLTASSASLWQGPGPFNISIRSKNKESE